MGLIGRLDQRVTIQTRTRTSDGGGGHALGWTNLATVWAKVAPLSGRERAMAEQLEAPRTYRVTIRRRGDVTADCRLLWNGQAMNIRFVADAGSRAPYLDLDCEMGVAS